LSHAFGLTKTLKTSWDRGSQKQTMKNFVLKSAMLMMLVSLLGCSSDDSSDCPQGLTGSDCNTKITPSKMIITKIVIKNYPLLKESFEFWDTGEDNSGVEPDILVAMSFGNQTIYNNEYLSDADGSEISFTINPPLELAEINENIVGLSILDYDGSIENSEFMAGVLFQLYSTQGTDFPAVITVTDSSRPFSADLHVTYQW
jgi:hypothetical protein